MKTKVCDKRRRHGRGATKNPLLGGLGLARLASAGVCRLFTHKAGIHRRRPERGFSWAQSPPDSKPPCRASRGSRTLAYFPVCFLDAPERRPGVSPWRSGVDLRAPFAACGPQARRPRAGQSNDREPARQPQFPRGHHTNKDRVIIFDTTLRDGEQSPGASMTLEEKLEVADLLDEMGVDIIEAGLSDRLRRRFRSVSAIAKRVKNATVAGLARAGAARTSTAAPRRVRHARRPRIHTFISTSPLHMKYKLQMEPEGAGDGRPRPVTRARNLVEDVEWSAEDGTRTEHRLPVPLRRGRDQGRRDDDQHSRHGRLRDAGGIRGACSARVRERVPNADKAIFSVHCHNDLGLAVANSLAGRRAAARGRSNARSTASASAPATPRSKRSSWRCARAPTCCPTTPTSTTTMLTRASKLVSARHLLPGAVQQGDRRPERLRARERHPPGRHAEERADLRDHDAGERRRVEDLAGHGQAFGPPRLPREAEGAGLRRSARTRSRTPSSASRISPTARRSSTTRTSRRWSTTRSATARRPHQASRR